jgi:hypothetical protein
MILVFMTRCSVVLTLAILRVSALIRRVLKAVVLLISVLVLDFLLPEILLHELVNHRVVVLNWDQIFSAIFNALDFDLLNYLLLKNDRRLLGLKYYMLFSSAFLVDDRT